MLRCKQVANALADDNFFRLPRSKQIGIRMHVALCVVCRRFHNQLIEFHRGEQELLRREEAGELCGNSGLSPEAKARIRASLQKAAR